MIKRLRRILTSRESAVALLLLMLGSFLVANIVPQRGPVIEVGGRTEVVQGRDGRGVVVLLGLDHVFSTRWFAVLSGLFLVSLSLTTWDQLEAARRKLSAIPSIASSGEQLFDPGAISDLLGRARALGYRLSGRSEACERYIKQKAGYTGSLLLHLGMTVTVLFGVVYALTEHRVIVRVMEGEELQVEDAVLGIRKGLLAGTLGMPTMVRLERLDATYWPSDSVKELASVLTFRDRDGATTEVVTAVSDKTTYRGMLLYQQTAYGTVFLLQFREADRDPFPVILPLDMPATRDKAAYGESSLKDGRFNLKAKYWVNSRRDSMRLEDPLLVLRLVEGERVLDEVEITTSAPAAVLGPYQVRMAGFRRWTDILFEGSRGMSGIFLGFAILLGGGLVTYLLVPRELLIYRKDVGFTVVWRAGRFGALYESERVLIFSGVDSEGGGETGRNI